MLLGWNGRINDAFNAERERNATSWRAGAFLPLPAHAGRPGGLGRHADSRPPDPGTAAPRLRLAAVAPSDPQFAHPLPGRRVPLGAALRLPRAVFRHPWH